MTLKAGSFSCFLRKGTLDALMSNTNQSNRNVVEIIRERYANRVSLFSIRNHNGFEEDIDGVLVLFISAALQCAKIDGKKICSSCRSARCQLH
ncbi:hypothetical protein OUZ56_004551 [Daphnia magna]|uniref:Uncharacterized protein n=1 Tax=Daphnia magna TaxID=35525 RepID=A0ABQ9YQ50_9CRUS|nr:hypothetical protein OUZ56_004551 [Daphnia magna]